eukprot:gene4026-5037_t
MDSNNTKSNITVQKKEDGLIDYNELLQKLKEIKDGFDKSFIDHLVFERLVKPGYVIYSLIVPKSLCNILNTLHGGAIATIVDVVSAVSIISKANERIHPGVSVEISVHYGSAAPLGSKIFIHSKCYKIGRNLAYSDTEIRNANDDIIAKGSHTKFFGIKDFDGTNGFDAIEKRLNQGTECSRLFLYFLKERAAIEENYAKSMTKLLKNTGMMVEFGTLRDAWLAIRGESEALVRSHHELSIKLDKDIAGPFKKFKSEQKKVKKQFLGDAYNLNRERRLMDEKVTKSKTKYDDFSKQTEQIAASLENAKSSGKPANEIGKIQTRLQKLQKDQSVSEQEYRDAVNRLAAYQPNWEDKTTAAYHSLQMTEEERIDYTKVQMEKYVSAIQSIVPDNDKSLVAVVARIDKYEDISCFVREHRTSSDKPQIPVFVPFGGKASNEYITAKSTANYNTLGSSSSSLNNSNGLGNSTKSSSLPSTPQQPKNTITKQARALYDYVGSDATELDFFSGDIISVIDEDDSGWWRGELDGRTGLFPSNYCEIV